MAATITDDRVAHDEAARTVADDSAVDDGAGELLQFDHELRWHQDAQAIRQAADPKAMTAEFIIVTNLRNQHGNQHRIQPSRDGGGLMTDTHQRNPIVMLEHGFGARIPFPVIGLSQDGSGNYTVKKRPNQASATVFFSQTNPDAAVVYAMVDDGTLKMASIGFFPRKGRVLAMPKREELPEGVESLDWMATQQGVLFTETQIFEWSIVSQGADPGAFKQALSRGNVNGQKVSATLRPWMQSIAGPQDARLGWTPAMSQLFDRLSASPDVAQQVLDAMNRQAAAKPDANADGDRVSISGTSQSIRELFGGVATQAVATPTPTQEIETVTEPEVPDSPSSALSVDDLFDGMAQRIGPTKPAPKPVATVSVDVALSRISQAIDERIKTKLAPVAERQKSAATKLATLSGNPDASGKA